MKAIAILNDTMVIREQRRQIDRDVNLLTVDLSVEAKFGTVINAEIGAKQGRLTFQVQKSRHPAVWSKIKDADNGVLLDAIADQLSATLPVVTAHRAEQDNPVTREAIQETDADGSVTFWYRDEDEAAFTAAAKRSGHAPTQVPQPNSHEEVLTALKSDYPVEEIQDLIDHLIEIGATAPFRTVQL